jgi:hypothetical protein
VWTPTNSYDHERVLLKDPPVPQDIFKKTFILELETVNNHVSRENEKECISEKNSSAVL